MSSLMTEVGGVPLSCCVVFQNDCFLRSIPRAALQRDHEAIQLQSQGHLPVERPRPLVYDCEQPVFRGHQYFRFSHHPASLRLPGDRGCGIGQCLRAEEAVVLTVSSHHRLSPVQWASLLLLTSSVASIQIAKSGTQQLSIPFLPAFLTILSSSLAGLAGVVIEKLMKGVKSVSIFQQNLWLNLSIFAFRLTRSWGALLNFVCLLFENGARFPQFMSLQAFNPYALLTVAKWSRGEGVINSTVLMGLITVGILKYLSSVVKSFTSSASLVMTSILSSLLLGVELKYPSGIHSAP